MQLDKERLDSFKKACGVYFLPLKKGGLDKTELLSMARDLRRAGHLKLSRGEDIEMMDRRKLCSVLKPAVKLYLASPAEREAAEGKAAVEGEGDGRGEGEGKDKRSQKDFYTKTIKIPEAVRDWLPQSALDGIASDRAKFTGGQTCQLGFINPDIRSEVLIMGATPNDLKECERNLRYRIKEIKRWNQKRPYNRKDLDRIVAGMALDRPFLLPEPHMQRNASAFGYEEDTPFKEQTANNNACFDLKTLNRHEPDARGAASQASTDPHFSLKSFIGDGAKEMLTDPDLSELPEDQLYVFVITNEPVRGQHALTPAGQQKYVNHLRLLPVDNTLEFGSKHWNLVASQAPVAIAGEMIRFGEDLFWNLRSGSFTKYLMRLVNKKNGRPLHGKIKNLLSKGGNPELAVWYADADYSTQLEIAKMLQWDLNNHYWQAETDRFLLENRKWNPRKGRDGGKNGGRKPSVRPIFAPALIQDITNALPLSKDDLRTLCESKEYRNRLTLYPNSDDCHDKRRGRNVKPLCDVLEAEGYFRDPILSGCPADAEGFKTVKANMRKNWNNFRDPDNMNLKTLVNRKTLSDVRDLLQAVHWLWHPLGEEDDPLVAAEAGSEAGGEGAGEGDLSAVKGQERLIKYDAGFGVRKTQPVETKDPIKFLLGAFSALYSQLAQLADLRKGSKEYQETLKNFNTVFEQVNKVLDEEPLTREELEAAGKGKLNYKLDANKKIPGAGNLSWDTYLREAMVDETDPEGIYEGYRYIKNYWTGGRSANKRLGYWGNVKKLLRGQIDRAIRQWEGRADQKDGIKDILPRDLMQPTTTPGGRVRYRLADQFHDYRVTLRVIRKALKFLWPVIPALNHQIPDEFLQKKDQNTGMTFGEAVTDNDEKAIARYILDDTDSDRTKRLFKGISRTDQDAIEALALLRLWTSNEPPCDDSCGLEGWEGRRKDQCQAMRRHCDLIYHMGLIHDHMVEVEAGDTELNEDQIAELSSYIEEEFEAFMQRAKDLNLPGILHTIRQALCP